MSDGAGAGKGAASIAMELRAARKIYAKLTEQVESERKRMSELSSLPRKHRAAADELHFRRATTKVLSRLKHELEDEYGEWGPLSEAAKQ